MKTEAQILNMRYMLLTIKEFGGNDKVIDIAIKILDWVLT